MTKESISIAHKILEQASQLWTWQLPKPNEYGYTVILDLLKAQKPEIIQAAFNYLRDNTDPQQRNFPSFFQWRNAVKEVCPSDRNLGPKMTLIKIQERHIRQYEKEAVELIKSWQEIEQIKQAKFEGWYGRIWDNYAVMPGGLAGYLYALTLRQIKILNPEIDAPMTQPRELIKTDYLAWISNKEFIGRVIANKAIEFLFRQSDLEKIKVYYLWAKSLVSPNLNLSTIFKN